VADNGPAAVGLGGGRTPAPAISGVGGGGVVPGDLLVDRWSLGAVVVLVVNDHWLKGRLGADPGLGIVTGKLSDVAGLAFFPLVLVSLLEVVRAAAGRVWSTSRRELAATVVAVGLAFAAIKVVPTAADAYAGSLAFVRWLPGALVAALTGAPSPPQPRIHHVMDMTDCLSLPALWWAYATGLRRRRARRGPP